MVVNTMINYSNYTINNSMFTPQNCGKLMYSLQSRVNGTIKVIIIVMILMLIFEFWALKRIMHSGESHDRKAELVDMILTFIHPIMIVFVFYLIYWIFLSGIDF